MNRHQLAQSFISGLLASGDFTTPSHCSDPAWLRTTTRKFHDGRIQKVTFSVIDAAYALADEMLKIEEGGK